MFIEIDSETAALMCLPNGISHPWFTSCDRDAGDEHRDPPPLPPDPIAMMFAEYVADGTVFVCEKHELYVAIAYAETMESCCAACALEINGEDGS